jgi:hypothetical protein
MVALKWLTILQRGPILCTVKTLYLAIGSFELEDMQWLLARPVQVFENVQLARLDLPITRCDLSRPSAALDQHMVVDFRLDDLL